jgi:hypothetical protein
VETAQELTGLPIDQHAELNLFGFRLSSTMVG